ncbi:hypothetical protein [Actinomadura kijaniata]|uniref:hypothetical protein n=1 Tax=Actinomadura kijaniata TaxID=46161 RepID=UPI00082CBB08|nr:hypothetical protein [Actinomadura kijaniata]
MSNLALATSHPDANPATIVTADPGRPGAHLEALRPLNTPRRRQWRELPGLSRAVTSGLLAAARRPDFHAVLCEEALRSHHLEPTLRDATELLLCSGDRVYPGLELVVEDRLYRVPVIYAGPARTPRAA